MKNCVPFQATVEYTEAVDASNQRTVNKMVSRHPTIRVLMKYIFIFLSFLTLLIGIFRTTTSFAAKNIYTGAFVGNDPSNVSGVTTFESDAGKKLSIVMWYQDWGSTDGTQSFQSSWMDNVRNHGSIPMITWEPWVAAGGANQPTYSLQNIINGNFDKYITQWALASKAWGHPYFLRFGHEMNGKWYPWSEQINGNRSGQYVAVWKHIYNIFTANKVTNITWVWSPNQEFNGSTPLSELYPGDNYTDWVAMDGYNWGRTQTWSTWQTFTQIFQQTYNDLSRLTTKPIMIGETASTETGGNKAQWITNMLQTQLSSFPQIRAFIWFNINKETDWRIESSSSSLEAYKHAIQAPSYQANSYRSLNRNPIPLP